MMTGEGGGYDQYTLDFQDQLGIYKRIRESTFREIWKLGLLHRHVEKDTLKVISYSRDGKYLNYLEILGNKRREVKEYLNGFMEYNEFGIDLRNKLFIRRISPKISWDWEYKVDFSDYNDQVMLTIISLTMNDSFYREEKK